MSQLNINLNELINNFKKSLANIASEKELYVAKNIFFNQNIKPLLEKIKLEKDIKEKKEIGLQYNNLNKSLLQIFEEKLKLVNELQLKKDESTKYDASLPSVDLSSGYIHPLNLVIDDIVTFFKKFNFDIFLDDELSTTEFTFDVLNLPLTHVTRSIHESLYLKNSNNRLLRTQCTASTAKFIHCSRANEIRVMTFGNVYRNDTEDSTHSIQFKQIDFMWLRNGLTVANLKWFINELIKYLFGSTQNTRFRISQFYFTEPSIEVDISCWNCQNGCGLCKYSKWIEILGCGMLHENVMKLSKLENKKMSGLAAGIGVERIAMLKYGLTNIHDFYKNDLRFLQYFKKK